MHSKLATACACGRPDPCSAFTRCLSWRKATLRRGLSRVVQVRRIPDPQPAAKPIKPDYANEPFVIEHDLTSYRYNADGTGDRTLSATVRIQSDAAVRAYGLLGFAYASDNESVEVKYVRVQQPDGTTIATEASAAEDQPSEVTREAPLYSDQRQLQIPVRGLAVGDLVSWQVVVHMRKAEAPGAFWGEINFEPTAVSLDQQVELSFPAGMKVNVLSPCIRRRRALRMVTWCIAGTPRSSSLRSRRQSART